MFPTVALICSLSLFVSFTLLTYIYLFGELSVDTPCSFSLLFRDVNSLSDINFTNC